MTQQEISNLLEGGLIGGKPTHGQVAALVLVLNEISETLKTLKEQKETTT